MDSLQEILLNALVATRALPNDDSDKKMILDQLEYLEGLFSGSRTDKSDLGKICLGVIAAREYEDIEPEYANKLYLVEKKVVHFLKYG